MSSRYKGRYVRTPASVYIRHEFMSACPYVMCLGLHKVLHLSSRSGTWHAAQHLVYIMAPCHIDRILDGIMWCQAGCMHEQTDAHEAA